MTYTLNGTDSISVSMIIIRICFSAQDVPVRPNDLTITLYLGLFRRVLFNEKFVPVPTLKGVLHTRDDRAMVGRLVEGKSGDGGEEW